MSQSKNMAQGGVKWWCEYALNVNISFILELFVFAF
jgi:hypothetical protein